MNEFHLQGMGEDGRGIDVFIDRFPFVIGRRRDCDYQLCHASVSRHHCCFLLKGEEVWIQDLESTNGTCVNGKRLEVPQALQEGDQISLDSFSFQVSFALVPT